MTAPSRPSTVVPVTLAALAATLGLPDADVASVELTGVALSSASVRPGDLYAALPGARTHGARYVEAAARAGAAAVLTDDAGADAARASGLPVLVVAHPRRLVARAAAHVYGDPAADLTLIGVTGTQGKTTTTHLVNAGLAAAGRRTAVIGTMGTWIDGRPTESVLTTPEAPDLHALFAVMREAGVDVCAMEVSSHAIVMGRVDGVVFDLAVFTNFGRDHLDFHGSVEEYFAAKAELFTPARSRRALVNADDPALTRLVADPLVPTSTFGMRSAEAHWRAERVRSSPTGSTFVVATPQGHQIPASVRLSGTFNVANALCAIAAVGEIGVDVEAAAAGVAGVTSVAGRMESVENELGISVVVDYAHKPDAVTAILEALRPVTPGRLLVVLGAGGDRDRGKRPIMGQIAARLGDVVIVTDDNPRSESPAAIRAEVIAGAEAVGGPAEIVEIGDRQAAIRSALRSAAPGDTVLIAGKGHERGQEVDGQVLDFDDRAVAAEVLAELSPSARP